MCGIAGWLDKYTDLSEQKTVIRHMVSSLKKRGRNGRKKHHVREYSLNLKELQKIILWLRVKLCVTAMICEDEMISVHV